MRYTARAGGGLLHDGAVAHLKTRIDEAQAAGSVRLFSVRREFPSEWAKFQSQTPGANQRYALTLNVRPEHYPFWSQGRLNSVKDVGILARSTKDPVPASLDVFDKVNDQPEATKKGTLAKDTVLGNLLVGKLVHIAVPAKPVGELTLFFDDKTMADLWIAVQWSSK